MTTKMVQVHFKQDFLVMAFSQGFGSRALAMAPRAAAEMVNSFMQRWKTA
jgi:hypothetical protein